MVDTVKRSKILDIWAKKTIDPHSIVVFIEPEVSRLGYPIPRSVLKGMSLEIGKPITFFFTPKDERGMAAVRGVVYDGNLLYYLTREELKNKKPVRSWAKFKGTLEEIQDRHNKVLNQFYRSWQNRIKSNPDYSEEQKQKDLEAFECAMTIVEKIEKPEIISKMRYMSPKERREMLPEIAHYTDDKVIIYGTRLAYIYQETLAHGQLKAKHTGFKKKLQSTLSHEKEL